MKDWKIEIDVGSTTQEQSTLIDILIGELMRYAGVANSNETSEHNYTITLFRPAHVPKYNAKQWAERNVSRINSFCFKAKAVAF